MLFVFSKATESKQVKLDTYYIVILPTSYSTTCSLLEGLKDQEIVGSFYKALKQALMVYFSYIKQLTLLVQTYKIRCVKHSEIENFLIGCIFCMHKNQPRLMHLCITSGQALALNNMGKQNMLMSIQSILGPKLFN